MLAFRIHGICAIACAGFCAGSVSSADIRFEEGIEYARPAGESLALNMARPAGDNAETPPRPAVICIHGGGFETGNRNTDAFVQTWARKLAQRGFVTVRFLTEILP